MTKKPEPSRTGNTCASSLAKTEISPKSSDSLLNKPLRDPAYEAFIQELYLLLQKSLDPSAKSEMTSLVTQLLLEKKQLELKKQLGSKITRAIFAEAQLRVLGNSNEGNLSLHNTDGKNPLTKGVDRIRLEHPRIAKIFRGQPSGLRSFALFRDGKSIALSGNSGRVKVIDIDTLIPKFELGGHNEAVAQIALSPDDKQIVTVGLDSHAKVWNAQTGEHLYDLGGKENWMLSADFSADGQYILSTSQFILFTNLDGAARIFRAKDGSLLSDLSLRNHYFTSAVFSHNQTKVAATYDTLKSKQHPWALIWDLNTEKKIHRLKAPYGTAGFNSLQFSKDDTFLLTTSDHNEASIWNVSSGKLAFHLEGHTDWVRSAQYSNDGRYIVTGSKDSYVNIWDAKSGELLFELSSENDEVVSATFSSDDKYIAAAFKNGIVVIWKMYDEMIDD